MDITAYFNSLTLPEIAANINGEFLEQSIIGYRTKDVKGRYNLSYDKRVTTVGNGIDRYRGKKQQCRQISIEYNLTSANELYHRRNLDKLNGLSNGEVTIRFLDEYDRYYVGTITAVTEDRLNTSGMNSLTSTGTITIDCTDPHKYSVEEFEAEVINFGTARSEALSDEALIPVSNVQYPIQAYPLLLRPNDGALATIQIKGILAGNRTCWGIYNSGGSVAITHLTAGHYNTGTGVWTAQNVPWKKGASLNTHVNVYPMTQNASGTPTTPNPPVNTIPSMIEWIKVTVADPDVGDVLLVDYRGSAPSYPIFDIQNSNNNPFVSLLNDREQIIQVGDASEIMEIKNPEQYGNLVYYESVTQNEDVLITSSVDFSNWTAGTQSVHSKDGCTVNGTSKLVSVDGKNMMAISNPGTGPNWKGCSRTFTLPQNSDGTYGALDFYAWFKNIFEITGPTQYGYQMISFIGDGDAELYSVTLEKGAYQDSWNNNTARIHWRHNSSDSGKITVVRSINFNATNNTGNPFRRGTGSNDLRVEAGKMRIYFNGKYEYFDIPAENYKQIKKIQVYLGCSGNQTLTQAVPYNYIGSLTFTRLSVPVTRQVARVIGAPPPITKNVFKKLASGDNIVVDCQEASIKVNGLQADGYGDIGNMWEKFCLRPGINQIRCVYSTKVSQPPKIKLRYREVYL